MRPKCKICDRPSTTAGEFHDSDRFDYNGNPRETTEYDIKWVPVFETLCKDCLRLILPRIRTTRRRALKWNDDWPEDAWDSVELYNKAATNEEFFSALAKYINFLATRLKRGEPITRCQALSNAGNQCASLAKGQFNGLWLCGFHKDKKCSSTVIRRDNLANAVISELGWRQT